MNVQDKIKAARFHIKHGEYNEARKILLTIRYNPTAKEWLQRLEMMPAQKRKQGNSRNFHRPART